MRSHVWKAEKYARDVIDGKILACKWTIAACRRHFADKERTDWNFTFDAKRANRACKFFELFPHTKGRWAAEELPFVLEPWQCFVVASIYGWVVKDGPRKGCRRFQRAMLMVPRKNGKSDFAARFGLYGFAADKEHGAEVYAGATSEKQAWEVFRPAHMMAAQTPAFIDHYGVVVFKDSLSIPANGSKFEPVKGKPGDGASPSMAIHDEYHEHKDDSQVATMLTGMGARSQPLQITISTAGDNMAGPCFATQKELELVLSGGTHDEAFWGIIYGIDAGDDWRTPEAARKANPNLGVSVSEEFIEGQVKLAIRQARHQNSVKTKHFNVWSGAREAFFNMESWNACGRTGMAMQDFRGHRLFVGIDLASSIDIASVVSLFDMNDGCFAVFAKCFVPEKRLEHAATAQYSEWVRDGYLVATPGDMIDYRAIKDYVSGLHSDFGIEELAFDPAYAQMLVQDLMREDGITCVEWRQTVINQSAPMKHLDALILSGRIAHDGDPCLAWQMSNVVARRDQKDNVFPAKEREAAKIDAAVAMINAMGRAMVSEEQFLEYRGAWTVGGGAR